MALSDAWLKANSGKDIKKAAIKTDRDGLGARVSPKGRITFQLRYRYAGTERRVDLGSYPLMGLKAARAEADRLRAELERGHDPKIVRLLEKQAIIEADSFEDLFRQWYEAYCKSNKTRHEEILRSFEIYVFPILGQFPADKTTVHEWLALLEPLAKKVPSIAVRVLVNAKQVYRWSIKRRLVEVSPLSEIRAFEDLRVTKGIGTRSLTDKEIAYLWEPLQRSRMAQKNKLFLKLCLVYGCRNGELRSSEKSHFDFDEMVWSVPHDRHKMGKMTRRPLLRPITEDIEPLIRAAIDLSGRGKYVFTNSSSSEPMGQSVPVQLPYKLMQWLRKNRGYEMAHWSVHDLRKTARTNFSKLAPPHVAELMLGHKMPGEWETYDHHHYLEEKTAAYSAWCKRLMEIVGSDSLI